jgi:hypothetical protein
LIVNRFVKADENTINSFDTFIPTLDEFDSMETRYTGAPDIGRPALLVPANTAAPRSRAVNPLMMGDRFFEAVT